MMKTTHAAWAAITLLAAASVAQAQGYVGAGVGPARINVDCTGLTTCDKSSTGYKLYGGFDFGGGLAGELNYFNWGKVKGSGAFDIDTGTGPTTVTGSGELKASGVGIGVAYFIPAAPNWVPVVRAGVVRNTTKLSVTALSVTASDKQRNTAAYVGFGVGYKLSPKLVATGELDFSRIKYSDVDKADARLVSIGLRYSF